VSKELTRPSLKDVKKVRTYQRLAEYLHVLEVRVYLAQRGLKSQSKNLAPQFLNYFFAWAKFIQLKDELVNMRSGCFGRQSLAPKSRKANDVGKAGSQRKQRKIQMIDLRHTGVQLEYHQVSPRGLSKSVLSLG